MKAISIQRFGDADGMASVEVPEPEPAAGQVLIEAEAIGVGGVDAVIRRGGISAAYGFTEGFIPGSEVAGKVLAVGDGVDSSWVGRTVWAFTGTGGAYVERAVAQLEHVTPVPEGLSLVDAVALGGVGPVAHFALEHGRFTGGQSLLVRGAAGSIGITAVQLAARAGSGTIAVTTSSVERGKQLRELGATVVLDRAGAGAEGAEFDVIVDVVGGEAVPSFIDRLADNGRMVAVGVVAGQPPADFGSALLSSFQRSRSFATFSLNTVPVPERQRVRRDVFAAAVRGELKAVVQEVLPLDQAAQAHRRMDAGEVFGRIVLQGIG
jgi:NADPH2:quinone reductase